MLSQTLEVLSLARSLIADPAAWCKGSNAERKLTAAERATSTFCTERIWCCYDDPAACAWCSNGAVELARLRLSDRGAQSPDVLAEVSRLLDVAALSIRPNLDQSSYSPLVALNDHADSTHADVLSMFDAAILSATPRVVEVCA